MSNLTNYKKQLADQLLLAVQSVYPEARRVCGEETEEGFYEDYDLVCPLNPDSFARITLALKNLKPEGAVMLNRFSGAYENGSADNRMLQRIYVLAFETQKELEAYQEVQKRAAQHDHKALNARLKLFSSSSETGQGLILWHPKGAMIRYCIEQFGQKAHILNDYQWVYTPQIGRTNLWRTSGHLEFYRDSMYSPIDIDGDEYYLKPMNCPFHIDIYNSEPRSYRDLPIRLAEYGTVYRYELSGTLSGLTRVRGFTQDDAHIFCREDQVESEIERALRFSLYVLHSFGFEQFAAYVSTRPEKKFIGEEAQWDEATGLLKKAVVSCGLDYEVDEGGGAFYGPKIDLKLKDSLGREWQCSTIQFDFNLPGRFNLNYTGSDGRQHTPYMVHRALFGSVERFTALLIEHYAGEFPLWLAPLQIGIVPIQTRHKEYCESLAKNLKRMGLRVSVNGEDVNMRRKIKDYELEKVPYLLIVGDRDMEQQGFSVRSRRDGNLGAMDMNRLMDVLGLELEIGVPKCVD